MKCIYISVLVAGVIAAGMYIVQAMTSESVMALKQQLMAKPYEEYLAELKAGRDELVNTLNAIQTTVKMGQDIEFEQFMEKHVQENLDLYNKQIQELEALNPTERNSIADIINKQIDERSALAQKQTAELIPDEADREAFYQEMMQHNPEKFKEISQEGMNMYIQNRSTSADHD